MPIAYEYYDATMIDCPKCLEYQAGMLGMTVGEMIKEYDLRPLEAGDVYPNFRCSVCGRPLGGTKQDYISTPVFVEDMEVLIGWDSLVTIKHPEGWIVERLLPWGVVQAGGWAR